MANLIKSEITPVLSIFRILTVLDEYIIAIGGVVEGFAFGIEHPRAAAIIGGIGFNPAPIARVAAIGQVITAEAVLDAE